MISDTKLLHLLNLRLKERNNHLENAEKVVHLEEEAVEAAVGEEDLEYTMKVPAKKIKK
jgi:hypothetical protein